MGLTISAIHVEGFGRDVRPRVVKLPATGIVVITGPNGAGKSTALEAVAEAVWGKALRGESLWRAGEQGDIRVTLADATVYRRVRNKRGAVTATVETDGEVVQAQTTTAANKLAATAGSLSSWARTSVFSSAEADRFSSATDAERKRLIEEVMGVGVFDSAHKLALAEAAKAQTNLFSAQSTCNAQRQRIAGMEMGIAPLEEALAAGPALHEQLANPAELELRASDLDRAAATALATLRTLNGNRDDLRGEHTRALTMARASTARADKLAALGECPTCGQTVPDALKAAAAAEATRQRVAAEVVQIEVGEDVADLDTRIADLTAEREQYGRDGGAYRRTAAEIRQQLAARQREAQARDAAQGRLDALRADITAERDKLEQLEASSGDLRDAVAVADAVVKVLSTKGIRAHLSARMLAAVQHTANGWLALLSGGRMTLELSATKELKSGGTSDAISLSVAVDGGGSSYKAMSGGERRRIDVALLLGLAEVVSAAQGGAAGTMFFDEAMDALDEQGVANTAAALAKLASDRCVVVITHSDALAAALPAVKRLALSL